MSLRRYNLVFLTILSIFICLTNLPVSAKASTVEVTFRAVDQYGVEITNARLNIDGYGRVLSGESIDVEEFATLSYSGKINSLIIGEPISEIVTDTTTELIYPFQTVLFRGVDQHGKEVSNASIKISSLGTFNGGGKISLPIGSTIDYRGKRGDHVVGAYMNKKITDETDELIYPFQTIFFHAKDQHGSDVVDATIRINTLGNYAGGSSVSLPISSKIDFRGKKNHKIVGSFKTQKITSTIDELTYPFQTILLNAKDENGVDVSGATIEISSLGSHAGGTTVSLPVSSKIDFRGKIPKKMVDVYVTKEITSDISELTYSPRNI